MLSMIESGIRGGIVTISHCHANANNECMGAEFDLTKESKFISYLDSNNLYGSCILEVDLDYPEQLHNFYNDYPLAAERVKI